MKILLRILLGLVTLSVVAVVGGYVILSNTDLETYRGLIREEVRKATGRELRMDGPINLELSLTPSVSISDVGLANASWGQDAEMVSISKFEAQLNLLPLISGQVDVSKIILDGATIRLEKNAQGQANFEFGEKGAGADQNAHQDSQDSAAGGETKIPVVRHLDIRNASISYQDATTNAAYALDIDQIGLSGLGQGDSIDLLVKLVYNEIAVDLSGQMGGIEGMTDPSVAFPLSIKGAVDGVDLALDGQVMDLQTAAGVDVNFTIDAKELDQLAGKLGQTVPNPGAVKAKGRINGDLNGTMQLVGLDASVERSDVYTITAKGEIGNLLAQTGMRIDLDMAVPSLSALNTVLAELNNEALNTQLAQYDGALIPDLGPLTLKATIAGGLEGNGLSVTGLDLSGGNRSLASFAVLGSVEALPGKPALNLGFAVEGEQLGSLSDMASQYSGTALALPNLGEYRVDGQVSGPVDGTLVMHSFNVKAGDETQNGLALTGAIADVTAVKGVDITLNAAVSDMSLFAGEGVGQLPENQRISLRARAQGGLDSQINISDLEFKSLKSDLGGNASIKMGGDLPDLSTNLTSNLIDLDEINAIVAALQPAQTEEQANEAAAIQTENTNAQGRQLLLSEEPLPLDGLKAANASVGLNLKQLVQAPYSFENINGNLSLRDGVLTIRSLETNLGAGALRLDVTLNAAGDEASLQVAANSQNIDLSDLVYINQIEGAITGPMNGDVTLSSKGNSVAALGANLSGSIKTVMLDGTVHAEKLRDMMGKGGTAVATLVTGGDLKVVPVYCQVNEITFTDGVGVPQVLLLDSPVTEILADGNVDLNDQTLDMLLSPKTRALSLPIRVKGFLEGPDVKPDPGATLANIGASALQGGNVLENLLGAKSRDTSPSLCLNYGSQTAPKVDTATQEAEQPATAAPLKAVEDIIKGENPEDALKEALGGGLKKLFGN